MPYGARKGAWHFDTMWTLPASMIGSTSFADRCCHGALDELESAFIRDVVERTTFPVYTKNVEIKYKLADLEVALNNPPNQLHITGYIQSQRQMNIDSSNLLRWFQATWSPIDGQLVRNDAYRDWSRPDPAYRHAQVHGEPAVATRGPGKKKVCVRPNPPNLKLDSEFADFALRFLLESGCYPLRFVSSPIFA
jgi:hypothetical protein